MEDQYRNASNLNARIALHERFGTNDHPWQRWIFEQFELPEDARILEVGCGPGNLWSDNRDRITEGWHITLTDASPGMLHEAEQSLGSRYEFRVADAQYLPFGEDGFDAVIANLMLHHVPDGARAISEFHRVLKPGGTLYAAENGENHMRELGPMLQVLDPSHPADHTVSSIMGFNLENGAEQLSPPFSEVYLLRYEDSLTVTEAKPLVDYVLSMVHARAMRERLSEREFEERVSMLTGVLEREVTSQSAIRIVTDSGLFVANY